MHVDERSSNKTIVPTSVQKVLDDHKDIMLAELPKKLPPRWEVDHDIELKP